MSGLVVEFNGGLKNLYSVLKCEEEEDDERIGLGDRVYVNKKIKGTIRYIGRVHYCKDYKKIYVGVECDGPYGRNNGTVKGSTNQNGTTRGRGQGRGGGKQACLNS